MPNVAESLARTVCSTQLGVFRCGGRSSHASSVWVAVHRAMGNSVHQRKTCTKTLNAA